MWECCCDSKPSWTNQLFLSRLRRLDENHWRAVKVRILDITDRSLFALQVLTTPSTMNSSRCLRGIWIARFGRHRRHHRHFGSSVSQSSFSTRRPTQLAFSLTRVAERPDLVRCKIIGCDDDDKSAKGMDDAVGAVDMIS